MWCCLRQQEPEDPTYKVLSPLTCLVPWCSSDHLLLCTESHPLGLFTCLRLLTAWRSQDSQISYRAAGLQECSKKEEGETVSLFRLGPGTSLLLLSLAQISWSLPWFKERGHRAPVLNERKIETYTLLKPATWVSHLPIKLGFCVKTVNLTYLGHTSSWTHLALIPKWILIFRLNKFPGLTYKNCSRTALK